MFIFPRRQQCYHLFGCETHANRAITTQSWDYLVYLRDLAVNKDRLPHHKKTSQSALEWWCHLLTVKLHKMFTWWHQWSCVSLLILAPELRGTVPLKKNSHHEMQLETGPVQINYHGLSQKTSREKQTSWFWHTVNGEDKFENNKILSFLFVLSPCHCSEA